MTNCASYGVGRLLPRKAVQLVMEALSKVRPDCLYELTILGDGEMAPYMEQWIRDFGLEDKADWRGMVPFKEVMQAYAEHDVLMFCSLRDSSADQYLEAMAHGLPIITPGHAWRCLYGPR